MKKYLVEIQKQNHKIIIPIYAETPRMAWAETTFAIRENVIKIKEVPDGHEIYL